jgi:hypothetical protein
MTTALSTPPRRNLINFLNYTRLAQHVIRITSVAGWNRAAPRRVGSDVSDDPPSTARIGAAR